MKAFLSLLGVTLFIGSALGLHLRQDSVFYLPLYLLSLYHLYRINYSKGFFLIYLTEPDKKESVKVRIGPTELEAKDDADRNEDKFIELFDWKKAFARRALSWLIFASAIYFLFFRLRVEITLESVLPILVCMCLMRVIAVGHLLVPLAINLFGALRNIAEYNALEGVLLLVYGVLFVVNLALIYPSEERLDGKLRDWFKGKWPEVARTLGILLMTFCAGYFLLRDFKLKKDPPVVKKEEIQSEIAKVDKVESKLKNMLGNGLMKDRQLLKQSSKLSDKLKELGAQEKPDLSQFQELKEKGEELDKEFGKNLSSGPAPELTHELLDYMKDDARSRMTGELDPMMEKRLQNFLKRAENFKGSGGDELLSEYREMKFGKGGYFKEETEFDHSPGSPGSEAKLEDIRRSEEKKKEIAEKLAKNIDELKSNPDEGLLSVNKALKDELDKVDALAGDDREFMKRELEKSKEVQKLLESKSKTSDLNEKLKSLEEENRHLTNELTPHMNAAEKSRLANKILEHQKSVESVGREVKEQISRETKDQEAEKTPPEEKDYSQMMKKLLRVLAFGAGAFLFLWFLNRFSQKGVKKVRGIPDEVKDELSEELRAIAKKNLSPREEVIETYNVFHEGLSTLVFTKETPPSCIVYEGIKSAEPELGEPTFTVTETFAKTFYGERDVTMPELKAFRKDVKKVFSFFDIRY